MTTGRSLRSLLLKFNGLGVKRVLVKELAPNDNSKNQVYAGQGFSSLSLIPVRQISTKEPSHPNEKPTNFKAKLDWVWLTDADQVVAPNAQLILYPAYPEVRISGFLEDCPVDAETARLMSSRLLGRVLFLGIAEGGRIYAMVGCPNSRITSDWRKLVKKQTEWKLVWRDSNDWSLQQVPLTKGLGGFYHLELVGKRLKSGTIKYVLERLQKIHRQGWHRACRMDSSGKVVTTTAPNAGGMTLEALLSIKANSSREPDFLGWELKNIDATNDRVTLFTPEPTGGLYGEKGVLTFVKKFGYPDKENPNRRNFSSPHYAARRNEKTKLILGLEGYSRKKQKITDAEGGIVLRTVTGKTAAKWYFTDLMYHWNNKHARVIFIPSSITQVGGRRYNYLQTVTVAERSDFLRFIKALSESYVYFDPGTHVSFNGNKTRKHARSQFRAKIDDLYLLYKAYRQINICEPIRIRAGRGQ